jgi:hypothetical protein
LNIRQEDKQPLREPKTSYAAAVAVKKEVVVDDKPADDTGVEIM